MRAALFVLLLSAAGCGAAAKGIPHVGPDDNVGDAVSASPTAPESPGMPGPSEPGGPGGGGGAMPQK
jgi:hypothetical protein